MNTQQNPIEAKQIIGYLPENNPLYLDMYIQETLEFQASLYQIKNTAVRIQDALQKIG